MFDTPLLEDAFEWIKQVALPHLSLVLSLQNHEARVWENRIEYQLISSFYKLRKSEIFDMIMDFPESQSSIDDLKYSINKIGDEAGLVDSLQSSISRRLLHQGATTEAILSGYISTIKAFILLNNFVYFYCSA